MGDLRRGAVELGAFLPLQTMVDGGAVAVVESGLTPPTVGVHGPLIAPSPGNPSMPRGRGTGLSPAEFVQPLVVDAEMMGDLVDDRDRDLVDHLLLGFADVENGLAVDGDLVGQ